MTDITIKKGDTPWALAVAYTGNGQNWPQFCKANPQLKTDATAGCLFYAGNVVHVPTTWPAAPGGSPPAPMPGPVPQPVGPAVATPAAPQVIDLDAPPAAAPATSSLFSDPKKVMIAGGIVAGAIVLVYAMKKKKA